MADFHAAYDGSLSEYCHDVRMGVQQNGEKEQIQFFQGLPDCFWYYFCFVYLNHDFGRGIRTVALLREGKMSERTLRIGECPFNV